MNLISFFYWKSIKRHGLPKSSREIADRFAFFTEILMAMWLKPVFHPTSSSPFAFELPDKVNHNANCSNDDDKWSNPGKVLATLDILLAVIVHAI
jgi:hypothetical protein